eukprot:jgi/Chrpa1/4430/Chrysochromulina_OHIO_Genome00007670-RA
MGGTLSAEEPPAEEALFDPEELRALRNCYAMLASPSNGALEITALLPWAALFRKGFPWAALFRKMTAASTPVRWQSFLGTIARCCKAQRSERLVTIASLYSGADDAPLDKAALKAMLSDALTAARGGGDEPAAVAATSSELDAVVADVLAGAAGGAVPIEAWIGWVTAQLPSLPTAVEGFLLHYLCAVGHASAAGAAIRSHSTAGAGGTRGSSAAQIATSAAQIATSAVHAEVPASVLAPLQEPLLSCAEGQSEGTELLTPPSAWLLSLAISRGAREEAADWRCVYASEVMGLSMNRFSHHADGYAGPTLLLVLTDAAEVFGAYIDSALKGSDKYFGSPSCLLFTLAPTFHVYRPTGLAKNFALYNPPQKGQLATTSYLSKSSGPPVPEVLGFGGQTARFRMVLEDDMKVLRWHASDTTYGAHPAPGGAPAEGVRHVRALRSSFGAVRALELWGCGGADADKVLRELRSRRVRDASRAGKVDRGAMFGLGKGNDWRSEDNPDRMILETAGAHTFYSHQLEKLPDENH